MLSWIRKWARIKNSYEYFILYWTVFSTFYFSYRYNKGIPISTIIQQDDLYLPTFLHCFIKSYYHLDKNETNKYLQNPGLIPDTTLSTIVFLCTFNNK